MALGAKKMETRSWAPKQDLVGQLLAIHAAKSFPKGCAVTAREDPDFEHALRQGGYHHTNKLPTGKLIAVGRLEEVWIIEMRNGMLWLESLPESGHIVTKPIPERLTPEYKFGDYSRGRYVWEFSTVVPLLEYISCSGMLGVWAVPADGALMVARDLRLSGQKDWAHEITWRTTQQPEVRLEDLYV